MAVDAHFVRAGCKTLPQFHFAVSASESLGYRASSDAIQRFGHGEIIKALALVFSNETGAQRDFNLVALPMAGSAEKLCVVRSRASGDIVVLGEGEYALRFGWPLPKSSSGRVSETE